MIKIAWNSLPRKSNVCQSSLYLYNSNKLLYFGSHRKMYLSISNVHFLFYLTNLTTHKKQYLEFLYTKDCVMYLLWSRSIVSMFKMKLSDCKHILTGQRSISVWLNNDEKLCMLYTHEQRKYSLSMLHPTPTLVRKLSLTAQDFLFNFNSSILFRYEKATKIKILQITNQIHLIMTHSRIFITK